MVRPRPFSLSSPHGIVSILFPHFLSFPFLELAPGQVAQHLAPGDPRHAPQRGEVERGAQTVGEAKEEHGRDPTARVLEREAALGHLVLLDGAAHEVVHAALGVDLGLVLARHVGQLGAREDVEEVVGGVAAGVALGADCGAENDEVFGHAWGGELHLLVFFLSMRWELCYAKTQDW